jgi:Uma2 family endonuclease
MMTAATTPATITIAPEELQQEVEGRVVQYAERPIPFSTFLELSEDRDVELIGGVMVEKMSAQLEHEKLFTWLDRVIGTYVSHRNLGILLGSRTAVEISTYGGRLPDLLFVRRERMEIVRERAVYGAPDLVIEIVSPNDRHSSQIALETEYRGLGVPEIVFMDLPRQRIRVLRRREQEAEYDEETLAQGALRLASVEGIEIPVAALLREPRPDEFTTVSALLEAARRG